MAGMLEIGSWVVLAFLLGLPVFWAWRLIFSYFCNAEHAGYSSNYSPRTCVILSLRGADPFLGDCLTGLLDQDHPNYQLHIVIDSEADPAWEFVHRYLARGCPRPVEVHVEALRNRRDTCSLKVSSILQALAGLPNEVETVALIDADVIPSRSWLRTLVAPLQLPSVGAATGLRWYAPRDRNWGTLVRYFWNGAAITQMNAFGIAWGGSLALHARVFQQSTALERWSHSFGEDTSTYGLVRELGLELRVVPEATMINAESTDLPSCCTFIRRQLFSARMNHVGWKTLAGMNNAITLALAASVTVLCLGVWTAKWTWVVGTASLLGLHVGGLSFAWIGLEVCIRKVVRRRGEAMPALPLHWKLPLAALLTEVVHFGCLIAAMSLRQISWRGIQYAIEDGRRLRVKEYQPYRHPVQVNPRSESVL